VFWHYTALGRYGEQLQHLFRLFPREQILVFRYRALIDDPARALDQVCAFLGVALGVLTALPRENVTAHPDPTPRHRALATTLRAGSAVTAALPGHAGSGVIDHLERILQQNAAPRRPLTWPERQELIPRFETDIRLLESVTGEDFSDWLGPAGTPAGWSEPGRASSGRPATGCRGPSDRHTKAPPLAHQQCPQRLHPPVTSWPRPRGGTGPNARSADGGLAR
jgi:hypothetical protein